MEAAYRLLFETLQRFGCVERTLFSSFGHGWLRDLKAQYPVLRTGLLYGGDPKTPEETLELVRAYNADAIHPYLHSINKEIVDTCLAHGIDVNVWTVDSPEDIALAVSYGVTGIITNVPRPGAGLLRGACVMETGCVHLYCGDGKGKTTAAMGLALRAAGQGFAVGVAQFLKDGSSGGMPGLGRAGQSHAIPVSSRGALHLCHDAGAAGRGGAVLRGAAGP